jgi:uncharacterized protein YggE
MKSIIKILFFVLLPILGFSQTELNPLHSTPYIEVTGEGELEIVPDEIYLQFTLKERYDGRTKITIETLEKKLRQKLQSKDIDIEKLSLADADASFVTIKRKKKDVLASKEYMIKVSGTNELSKVLDVLDNVDAINAHISKVDHSTMDDFKKEVKIKAVKNAKEKAEYMLAAVEQKVGKALFIQERETYAPAPYTRMKTNLASFDEELDATTLKEPEISFQKINLKYKVFARFAID